MGEEEEDGLLLVLFVLVLVLSGEARPVEGEEEGWRPENWRRRWTWAERAVSDPCSIQDPSPP